MFTQKISILVFVIVASVARAEFMSYGPMPEPYESDTTAAYASSYEGSYSTSGDSGYDAAYVDFVLAPFSFFPLPEAIVSWEVLESSEDKKPEATVIPGFLPQCYSMGCTAPNQVFNLQGSCAYTDAEGKEHTAGFGVGLASAYVCAASQEDALKMRPDSIVKRCEEVSKEQNWPNSVFSPTPINTLSIETCGKDPTMGCAPPKSVIGRYINCPKPANANPIFSYQVAVYFCSADPQTVIDDDNNTVILDVEGNVTEIEKLCKERWGDGSPYTISGDYWPVKPPPKAK